MIAESVASVLVVFVPVIVAMLAMAVIAERRFGP
jgi:hypothetical protein